MKRCKRAKFSNDLPESRFELFFNSFSAHFDYFVLPNLFTCIFYIPLFLWLFFCISTYLLAGYGINIAAADTLWLLCFGTCICFVAEGPVQCGMAKLMRAWSRNEPCFRMATFFSGMKSNWKKGLAFSTLYATILLVSLGAGYIYLSGNMENSALSLAGLAFSFLLFIFAFLCRQSMYGFIVTYEISLLGLAKNSLIISVVDLWRGIGVCMLQIAPPAVLAISVVLFPESVSIAFLAYIIYYLLIGFSVDGFVRASFCNYLMDKYININIPGARVNIGMGSEFIVKTKEHDNG